MTPYTITEAAVTTDTSPSGAFDRPSGYRPDIDGLRAVAVLMVVAYHLQLHGSHGGFVGVDIFFVISGYLITSIILRELGRQRFTIGAFYVRRIRRILPALLAVVLAVSLAAYRYMLPTELLNYGQSLLASMLFSSNFFFWAHSGYFDTQAASMPLLHTWSLSIEEQFYLLFPGFLIVLHRYKKSWLFPAVLLLALASFFVNLFVTYRNGTSAFYDPFTRVWELLVGSLLALKPLPGARGSAAARNLLTTTGLALIMFCAGAYYPFTRFPGLAALAPCLAALCIIGGGEFGPTIVGRLLSSRPFVFVGLISYSLYLWHWPVIVFLKMRVTEGVLPNSAEQAIALGLSFAFAVLSWRFVERPFRHGLAPQSTIFRYTALALSLPVLIAGLTIAKNGFPQRYDARAVAVASYLSHSDTTARYRTGSCFITFGFSYSDFDPGRCLQQSTSLPNYLVLGDSHAAQLTYGLQQRLPFVNWMQATASGCKPVLPSRRRTGAEDCLQLMRYILQEYLKRSTIDTVVLAGYWNASDTEAINVTVQHIQRLGRKVLLVGPIMEYSAPLPRLLAIGIQRSDDSLAERHLTVSVRLLDTLLKAQAQQRLHVPYFSYFDSLCPQVRCREYAASLVPLQEDDTHLTGPGSVLVAEQIRELGLVPYSRVPPVEATAMSHTQ